MMLIRPIVALAAATLLIGARQTPPPEVAEAPGEGVVCAWAILSFVSEAAEQCRPHADPERKAALRRAVGRLDDYMRANAHMDEAQIAAFKSDQGHVGAMTPEVCAAAEADTMGMVDGMLEMSPADMDAWSAELTARPGEPTWGTCL